MDAEDERHMDVLAKSRRPEAKRPPEPQLDTPKHAFNTITPERPLLVFQSIDHQILLKKDHLRVKVFLTKL